MPVLFFPRRQCFVLYSMAADNDCIKRGGIGAAFKTVAAAAVRHKVRFAMPFWIIKGAVPSPRSLEKSSIGCDWRRRPDQSQVEIVDIYNCSLAAAEFVKAWKQLRLRREREGSFIPERAESH